MADDKKLLWGKPGVFEKAPLTNGTPGTFVKLELPKDGTLMLSTEEGEEVEALEEGGDVVDSYRKVNKYTVEWDEFVKNGVDPSFDDSDGIVDGEYALRWTGRTAGVPGILAPRCVISATKSYSTSDGYIIHYKAKVLKPTSGKMIQSYTPAGE